MQHPDDSRGVANPGAHFEARRLQALRYDLGGSVFLEAQFGVTMKVAPQGNQAILTG